MTTASKALRRIRRIMSDDSRGFEHSALLGAVTADHANIRRIAELEARISALIAGAILPVDGADEITVDGVRWVRVPAEATVEFKRCAL